ncbi:hypothetical protein M427DRAFT_36864 [Gonapodya prolifera JEL478]|uniref:Uncharacterized protein n=1 Tax=Gonapodya prolifera (strain JEL478) TaxID=1344416 RepID=A0A139A245_GONPJ|nr:hypothetical protein M427DRAFT_36864 [Gonapodya prolifera JEL478]|eukprot:KXS10615.1 hypothetical protein M427DRAFT_36864 [Gonapodya prolifera JEL478]
MGDADPRSSHQGPSNAWVFLSLHFSLSVLVLIAGPTLSSIALFLALPKRLATGCAIISPTAYCQFESSLVVVPSLETIDDIGAILAGMDGGLQVLSLVMIAYCYIRIGAKVWLVLSRARREGLETKLQPTVYDAPTIANSRALIEDQGSTH